MAPFNFQDVKQVMDAIAIELGGIRDAKDFFPTILKHIPADEIANHLAKHDAKYAIVMASAKIQRDKAHV